METGRVVGAVKLPVKVKVLVLIFTAFAPPANRAAAAVVGSVLAIKDSCTPAEPLHALLTAKSAVRMIMDEIFTLSYRRFQTPA